MKKSLARTVCAIAFLLVFGLVWDLVGMKPQATGRGPGGPGSVRRVSAAYQKWTVARSGMALAVSVGWSKGLSVARSEAKGRAVLDRDGSLLTIDLEEVADRESFDAWLVHNVPGPKRSVRPEPGDDMVYVGTLERVGKRASLHARLPPTLAGDFDVDLIVLTRSGAGPVEGGVLFGSPTLFQRLATQERRRPTAFAGEAAPGGGLSLLLRDLSPVPAHARSVADTALDPLVTQGRELFFNGTFAGNGRTCGTCHRAENNFTIDPKFIASLPPTDPLFVAEFNPALRSNFEKPALMREMGLILENLDGFDDLASRFVMRGVPHTLALLTSLTPANGADGSTIPPNQRTGWSGDGAPGGGTLREFAIGAVTQHFTQTLRRAPGIDFRLPTDEELDALEAFQLSLGRQQDLDLGVLRLRNPLARRGQEIFLAGDTSGGTVAAGKCNLCHANAGASFSGASGGLNFNFDTGVEALPDNRADLILPGTRRPDGGFGTAPHPRTVGAFGNGTFNTPSLVEAADTAPFFHNNVLRTVEESVAFYSSQAFNKSHAGRFLASRDTGGIGITLEPTQVSAVGAFLRVINSLENIRFTIELQRGVQSGFDPVDGLKRAVEELKDAIAVLEEIRLHRDAVGLLHQAVGLTQTALASPDPIFRDFFLDEAIRREEQARAAMTQ